MHGQCFLFVLLLFFKYNVSASLFRISSWRLLAAMNLGPQNSYPNLLSQPRDRALQVDLSQPDCPAVLRPVDSLSEEGKWVCATHTVSSDKADGIKYHSKFYQTDCTTSQLGGIVSLVPLAHEGPIWPSEPEQPQNETTSAKLSWPYWQPSSGPGCRALCKVTDLNRTQHEGAPGSWDAIAQEGSLFPA